MANALDTSGDVKAELWDRDEMRTMVSTSFQKYEEVSRPEVQGVEGGQEEVEPHSQIQYAESLGNTDKEEEDHAIPKCCRCERETMASTLRRTGRHAGEDSLPSRRSDLDARQA
jgi:hypothetical protein